jgi:hypothetical protein
VEVTDEDDKQIIDCVELVSFYGCYFKASLLLSWFPIFLIHGGSHFVKEHIG